MGISNIWFYAVAAQRLFVIFNSDSVAMVVTSRVHPATCVASSVIYCRCNCDRQNWLPIESVCTPALLVATPNILLRVAIPLRSILDAGFCLLGLPFGLSIEHSLARSLLLDWKTMAPTTQLALSHMGLDICDMIDSFRNPVVFRAPIDIHGRAALYKAQHRWATLFKKREVTMRFDIELPPYPGLVGDTAPSQLRSC